MKHESPFAWDPTDKSLFRVPRDLQRDSAEFARIDEMCRAGAYVCGADDCEEPELAVVASGLRRHGDGVMRSVSAHFRHRKAARHGLAGEKAGPSESLAHQAAKHHLHGLGRSFGHRAEVEVYTSTNGVTRRPDVVWFPSADADPWALEIQFSAIPTWQWKQRTTDLERLGYQVLWFWGNNPRASRGTREIIYDSEHHWSERYRLPSGVWVAHTQELADGEWAASVAQCHSVEFDWEEVAAETGHRPRRWPNSLEYDHGLAVEPSADLGVVCPEVDARLSEIELQGQAGRLRASTKRHPSATHETSSRSLADPSVVARRAMTPEVLSQRHDRCGSCGDPLFVCPATVRRFVRCCDACTHRTQVGLDYERHYPTHATPRRTS